MLTAPHAFVLGHAVPIIGIYFRGVDLLAWAKQRPALAARATELLAQADGRKGDVIGNVRRVEGLLGEIPATVGAPPRLPNDYDAWQQQIVDAVEAQVKPDHPGVATIHLLGRLAGGGLASLNLGTYVLSLLAAAPGDEWAREQQAGEVAELRRLGDSLHASAGLFTGASDARAALTEFADDLRAAPLAAIRETQGAMQRCAERLSRVERALAA